MRVGGPPLGTPVGTLTPMPMSRGHVEDDLEPAAQVRVRAPQRDQLTQVTDLLLRFDAVRGVSLISPRVP